MWICQSVWYVCTMCHVCHELCCTWCVNTCVAYLVCVNTCVQHMNICECGVCRWVLCIYYAWEYGVYVYEYSVLRSALYMCCMNGCKCVLWGWMCVICVQCINVCVVCMGIGGREERPEWSLYLRMKEKWGCSLHRGENKPCILNCHLCFCMPTSVCPQLATTALKFFLLATFQLWNLELTEETSEFHPKFYLFLRLSSQLFAPSPRMPPSREWHPGALPRGDKGKLVEDSGVPEPGSSLWMRSFPENSKVWPAPGFWQGHRFPGAEWEARTGRASRGFQCWAGEQEAFKTLSYTDQELRSLHQLYSS